MIHFHWGLSQNAVGNVLIAVSLFVMACYVWERVRIHVAARNIGSFFDDY
jgi:hypothetical protein